MMLICECDIYYKILKSVKKFNDISYLKDLEIIDCDYNYNRLLENGFRYVYNRHDSFIIIDMDYDKYTNDDIFGIAKNGKIVYDELYHRILKFKRNRVINSII